MKRTAISMAVASACAIAALPAQAQVQAPDESPATDAPAQAGQAARSNDAVSEVVVTATRFATSLLKTPVAVTALSQEQLTRKGAISIKDLRGEIPNVVINEGEDSGVQITIRGITSSNFTETGDPAVGFHVDGLYSPRPQGAQALMFDIEQFEVLRGPQGTLFGRNSTGGSVNVITAKPDFSGNYGKFEADLGNYNKRQINVVQNHVVNDKLALRGTFMKVTRDGYANQMPDFSEANFPSKGFIPNGKPDVDMRHFRHVGPEDYYTNQDQWAVRLAAAYKATDKLMIRAAFENFQNNNAGYAVFRDCDSGAGTRYACTGSRWDISANVIGDTDQQIRSLRTGLAWEINDNTSLDYNFQVSDQRRSQIADDDLGLQHAPPWATNIVQYPKDNNGSWGSWPLTDSWHRTADSRFVSTVHELQLKQAFKNFKYVSGLFWMHERNRIDFEITEAIKAPMGYPGSVVYSQPNRQVDAKAFFTQADWTFAPSWTATLGARYSQDSKEDKGGKTYGADWISDIAYYRGLYNPGIPGTPGFKIHDGTDLTNQMGWAGGPAAYAGYATPESNDHKESWSKITWRAGLQWDITPRQMAYASVSTGYKAGGFGDKLDSCNYRLCATTGKPGEPTFLPYGPETVKNYELGWKGRLLDNTLSLSVTAFYSRYRDMQLTGSYFVNQIIPPTLPCPQGQPKCDVFEAWRTINVGNTKIPGLEVEWDWKPWKNGRLGGGFAYINSSVHGFNNYSDEYLCSSVRTEFGVEPCPAVYNGPDKSLVGRKLYSIEGNHLPNTPKYQLYLNFSQSFDLDNGYRVTPYVKVNWRDKAYFDLRNSDWKHIGRYQKAYAMADASMRLDSPGGAWYAEAYVRNLTDSRAKTYGDSVSGGFMMASYVEPRMFGIRAGLNY